MPPSSVGTLFSLLAKLSSMALALLVIRQSCSLRLLTISCHFASATSKSSLKHIPFSSDPCLSYLFKECGITQEDINNMSRRQFKFFSRIKTLTRLQTTVNLLQNFGFNTKRLITNNPDIISMKADSLESKITRLKDYGFTHKQIISMASKAPGILTLSLERKIHADLDTLTGVFGGKNNLTKALESYPSLLTLNMENVVKPSLEALEKSGIEGENLCFLVNYKPRILYLGKNTIHSRLQLMRHLGIIRENDFSRAFVRSVGILVIYKGTTVEEKIGKFQKLGFEYEEVIGMLKRLPLLIDISERKLKENVEFLVANVGYDAVVRSPCLLCCSMAGNLRPRVEVIRHLKELEPDLKLPRLMTVFTMVKDVFLNKYVLRSSHSDALLEIYNRECGRGKGCDNKSAVKRK